MAGWSSRSYSTPFTVSIFSNNVISWWYTNWNKATPIMAIVSFMTILNFTVKCFWSIVYNQCYISSTNFSNFNTKNIKLKCHFRVHCQEKCYMENWVLRLEFHVLGFEMLEDFFKDLDNACWGNDLFLEAQVIRESKSEFFCVAFAFIPIKSWLKFKSVLNCYLKNNDTLDSELCVLNSSLNHSKFLSFND